jgi:DOPA 4,5-dioxygenase
MELRDRMRARFPWMRFHRPHDRPIGPHPLPMWEADFASYEHRDRWDEVRGWLEGTMGGVGTEEVGAGGDAAPPLLPAVLIHPHSTDGDYADHTKHAHWVGEALELRREGGER